jgi:hypothetical protein
MRIFVADKLSFFGCGDPDVGILAIEIFLIAMYITAPRALLLPLESSGKCMYVGIIYVIRLGCTINALVMCPLLNFTLQTLFISQRT